MSSLPSENSPIKTIVENKEEEDEGMESLLRKRTSFYAYSIDLPPPRYEI